jgi:CubicO group peptidase (beta-lactamase class C family)
MLARRALLVLLAAAPAAVVAAGCAPAVQAVDPAASPAGASSPVAAAPAAAPDAGALARVDAAARAVAADERIPSVAVAIAVGDSVVYARGYGEADREAQLAAAPDVVYRIGSVTKQFTAAAFLRLVEQGRIALDDPLTKYLPDYPAQGHTVTIRQLLNHTSGIKSYTGLPAWISRMEEPFTHEQMLKLFASEPFDFAPGEQWKYNNSGYYLLGMVLEQVTGRPYAEYVAETLFAPLGLASTAYCPDQPTDGQAEGYRLTTAGIAPAAPLSMTHPYAAGALCSTVLDLVRWNRALVAGRVIRPATYRAMTTPDTLNSGKRLGYGYGLALDEWEGMRRVQHGGGINGFGAFLSYYPEHDVTIAVLENTDAYNPARTEEAIARALFDIAAPEVKDLPLTAEQIARYVGTYDLGRLQLRVFSEGDRLMAQGTGQMAIQLRWQGGDDFRAAFDERVRIIFEPGGERAGALTLYQGGAEMRAPRVQ